MSAYVEITTQQGYTDLDTLLQALRDLNFTPEVYDQPVPLMGYLGDERAERATIVVRRRFVGPLSNDIGFRLDGNAYVPIISEFDQSKAERIQAAYNKVRCTNAQANIRAQAKKLGYKVVEAPQADGSVQMTLVRRTY